jgi:hypothetical protein
LIVFREQQRFHQLTKIRSLSCASSEQGLCSLRHKCLAPGSEPTAPDQKGLQPPEELPFPLVRIRQAVQASTGTLFS